MSTSASSTNCAHAATRWSRSPGRRWARSSAVSRRRESCRTYAEWVTTLAQRDVLLLLDPALTGPGVFWGQRVMSRVADILDGAQIEDLPIPFTAVATDLTNSREVWFQRGSVATAMRASIGIPSVFTPVMVDGRLLADGGLLNPVPVDPLHGVPADRTIAVSLAGRRAGGLTGRPVTETASNEGFMGELSGWFRRGVLESGAVRNWRDWWTERFFPADAPRAVEAGDTTERSPDFDFGELPKGLKLGDVVSLSLETAEALITRFRLAASPPDTLIEFGQDMASTFDFHRAAELIEIGRDDRGARPRRGRPVSPRQPVQSLSRDAQ
jgi:NTE family protein